MGRKDKDFVQGMLKQTPSCCCLFRFPFPRRLKHLLSQDIDRHLCCRSTITRPLPPPPGRVFSTRRVGVRNGGEGVTAHQVRVNPWPPTATPQSVTPSSTEPSERQRCWLVGRGQTAEKKVTPSPKTPPETLYLFS